MLRQFATFVGSNMVRHRDVSKVWSTKTLVGNICCTRPLATAPSFSARRISEEIPTVTIESKDGRKFAVLDSRKLPNLKPSIVRRRLDRMRTYVGKERDIRHSPWRLNLICQMIAGLPVPEAFLQLKFCEKSRAPLVSTVLQRVVSEAFRKDFLKPSQLEVSECFVTKGTPLKRIKPMGKGRSGKMTRAFSHMRLVVREIDFKLRIYQQKTYGQKKKWLNMKLEAEKDAAAASAERKELEELEAQQRELEEQEKRK